MRESNIEVSTKHISLKVIIFIVAIVIALGGIGTGVYFFFFHKEPGWYQLSASARDVESDHINYAPFYYYCDGAGSSVKDQISTVTSIYDEALLNSYIATNEQKTYSGTGYTSIADINSHIGTVVSCGDTLYPMLKKAYEVSNFASNFSIFAAPLYGFWDTIGEKIKLGVGTATTLDPVYNNDSKTTLETLYSYVTNSSNYSLVFNDEAKQVTLNLSESYQNYLTSINYTGPIISFNVLKDTFMCDYIYNQFKAKNYFNGLISFASGISQSFGSTAGTGNLDLAIHDIYNSNTIITNASVSVVEGTFVNEQRHFSDSSNRFDYRFTKDDHVYFRCSALDLSTGYPNDYIRNFMLITKNPSDLISKSIKTNSINKITNESSLNSFINDIKLSNDCFYYSLNDKNNKGYFNNDYASSLTNLYPSQFEIVFK